MTPETTPAHPIVSPEEWLAAGAEFLKREKAFTQERDALSAARRELPWTKVEKTYVFDTPDGPRSLSELFDGRSQLVVYHFMFAPGDEEGCPGCSFVCDHVDAARRHFEHHDVAFVAVSRAPLADFQPFKRRMGWTFRWASSNGGSFNYDYGVSFRREDLDRGPVVYNFVEQRLRSEEQPGLTVFAKDAEGNVYRTYSTYERGLDLLLGAYNFMDLTPQGRNESGPMSWVKFHDRYED